CKPKPPGVNFTYFLERELQEGMQDSLGEAFMEELNRFDAVDSTVASAWRALSPEQDLFQGQVWLDWNPRSVEADPAGGHGATLDLRLSYVVEPEIRSGSSRNAVAAPLPPPVVHVADNWVKIPVDVTLQLDDIAAHLRERFARAGEGSPFGRVRNVR